MKLFTKNGSPAIVLEAGAPDAIVLAARDLQRDLRRLSGQAEGFSIAHFGSGIHIRTVSDSTEEAYRIEATEDGVTITGSDVLGTVYGIYAFATRCLGIVPVHRLVDLFPETREELELAPVVIESKPRNVKFRGWFLNDEDLLTDFKLSGGKRYMDYPWYGNTMDVSVLDMILETALRLELNLVIPSSFVDLLNPPERALVQQVCRRGLYVSQHHIEPAGVSHFTAENYLKNHGCEGESVSFVQNRSRMEEIWRTYIEAWAVYGKQVVWQLGLRGKGDRAVWQHDPNVPDDNTARGSIISDAIATQYRIIADTLGTEDFYSTSTLWMEGAELYADGHLRFPDKTVVVFSDLGFNQLFGDDFFRVPRLPQVRYGIYYHIAYWHTGPHLAEGTDPRRMAYAYRLAQEKNSLTYSILNVSNVRPLHISAWLNAALLADPAHFDPDSVLDQLLKPEEKALFWTYFDCIPELGSEELKRWCDQHLFHYHTYQKLPFPEFPVQDAMLRTLGYYWLKSISFPHGDQAHIYRRLKDSIPKWRALFEMLKDSESPYLRQFLRQQTFHMLQLTQWACAAYEIRFREDSPAARAQAAGYLRGILDDRKILEQGQWKNWHRGDTKVNIPKLLEITEER